MSHKKNKKMSLNEFLPALAAVASNPAVGRMVGQAALSHGLGKMAGGDKEEVAEGLEDYEDSGEEYGEPEAMPAWEPEDGMPERKKGKDRSGAENMDMDLDIDPIMEMMEEFNEQTYEQDEKLHEDEGILDKVGGALGKAGMGVAKVASLPQRGAAAVAGGAAKGALGSIMSGAEPELDEGLDELFDTTVTAAGTNKQEPELEEEMYPAKKHYPEDGPFFPQVKKEGIGKAADMRDRRSGHVQLTEAEEDEADLDEEMYPAKKHYPEDGPFFPQVKKEGLREGGMQMIQPIMQTLGRVVQSMDAETIGKVLQVLTQTLQGQIALKSEAAKPIKITKKQLKEAMVQSIVLHERKKFVNSIVQEVINEQVKVKKLVSRYLREVEGGMWPSSPVGQPQAQPEQAQDQGKQGQQMIQQAMRALQQAKGKYDQEKLKSAELVTGYHDAVKALVQVVQQTQALMNTMERQTMGDQVASAEKQFQEDMASEKAAIEQFLGQAQPAASAEEKTA